MLLQSIYESICDFPTSLPDAIMPDADSRLKRLDEAGTFLTCAAIKGAASSGSNGEADPELKLTREGEDQLADPQPADDPPPSEPMPDELHPDKKPESGWPVIEEPTKKMSLTELAKATGMTRSTIGSAIREGVVLARPYSPRRWLADPDNVVAFGVAKHEDIAP